MLRDESDWTQVLRLWDGLRQDLRDELKARYYDEEVNTWEEIVNMAKILNISRRRVENRSCGDYEHNHHANNHRTNKTTEHHKWNDIPRHKHDYSLKPARQSFNDKLHELSNVPWKGLVQNWEKPMKDKMGPWKENKLNKKQRDEYLAEGKCFRCGKTGHMSCQCPDGNTVSSGSRSGPPGCCRPPQMSSSSIQMKLKEADCLTRVAESSSTLQSNNIELCMDSSGTDSTYNGDWSLKEAEQWLAQPMGDMLEEWWTWRMNSISSWPDSVALPEIREPEGKTTGRFCMYRTKGMKYVLFDRLRMGQDKVLVPPDIVQYGDMIHWYNTYLVQTYGIAFVPLPALLARDLMALFIEEYLDDAFNTNYCHVAKCFTISYKSPNVFKVRDCALGHAFDLPHLMVLHPRFQLYNWWLARVQHWECHQCGFSCWAGSRIGFAITEGDQYVGDWTPPKLPMDGLYIRHVGHKCGTILAIKRNLGIAHDFTRLVPRPMVVEVSIEGNKA
ncbi:hypothetical protein EDD18DRAFT_1357129 [Armillaria luteobubalina]|uniref:CCHC-type domain-containing protein n=1 Tax=Armillaria luteobubalina TaxID=153913 RepID=A0AA39ULP0_9AGAR|nr:hypothetical protein EDD18DRAFT_1357129 [Armillaria luteobubalina]